MPDIRPFAPADQPAARRLILEGLGEHFGVIDETCNPDLDDITTAYVTRGHRFLVIEDATGLVGTGALVIEDAAVGRIVRMSIAPAWRRRGLARQVLQRLIADARAAGLTRLWVETNDDWLAPINLYQAAGFQEYDRRDGNIYLALDLPAPECTQLRCVSCVKKM